MRLVDLWLKHPRPFFGLSLTININDHPLYKPMEKLLTSAVDQKSLELGVVITWVISIVQKNIHCHSNIP